MDAIKAIKERSSVRSFLDTPVNKETVQSILDAARWAPSGVNIQPWEVAVVTGGTKSKITDALCEAHMSGAPSAPDYKYYPDSWEEPFISRRVDCGTALYSALGISRDDKEKRTQAWLDNFRFFGAPVGLFFFMRRGLGLGAYLDMGMFIQNVSIAAKAKGLDTCPQASLAAYPDIVKNILGVPDSMILICGMSLGYADMSAKVNQYRLPREDVESFTKWFD